MVKIELKDVSKEIVRAVQKGLICNWIMFLLWNIYLLINKFKLEIITNEGMLFYVASMIRNLSVMFCSHIFYLYISLHLVLIVITAKNENATAKE